MGVGGQCHGPATFPPGMTQCPLYRRLGGGTGLGWMGAENLSLYWDGILFLSIL